MILAGDKPLAIGGRYGVPGSICPMLTDADCAIRSQPFIVLRQVTYADWKAWAEANAVEGLSPEQAWDTERTCRYFYEVSTD